MRASRLGIPRGFPVRIPLPMGDTVAMLPRTAAASVAALALAIGLSGLAAREGAAEATHVLDLAEFTPTETGLERVYGSVGDGRLGLPVTGGHDLDGDGLPDAAFSAMLASPLGRLGAGEVFVAFGDGILTGVWDTAVPHPRILHVYGDGPAEAAGNEIWMDDVTGDGVGDLLIARQNFRPDAARPGAGALSIVVGGPKLWWIASALDPLDLRAPDPDVAIATIVGAEAVDRLGIWMRTGDVTGDGIADIVVGADQEDGPGENDRGALYVIRGGPHLAATQTIDLASFGATALAGHLARVRPPAGAHEFHFGSTVQIADLDGNGRGEVLAAAALARAGASIQADGAPGGSAHSSGGSLDGTLYIAWDDNFIGDPWPAGLDFVVTAGPGSSTVIDGRNRNIAFGEEILGGRDYDDDGAADLFVGDIIGDLSPLGNRVSSGSGHVFFDAGELKGLAFDLQTPPPGLVVTEFLGAFTGDIAADTAAHGDFDGDGIGDLSFSAPHASPLGRASAGILYVFYGRPGGWPALVDLRPANQPPANEIEIVEVWGAHGTLGGDAGDTLGYSEAAADLDGDGTTDIIVNEMQGNGVAQGSIDAGNLVLIGGPALRHVAVPALAPPFAFGLAGLLVAAACAVVWIARAGRTRRPPRG